MNKLPVLDPLHDTAIPKDKFFDMIAKGLLVKPKLLYSRYGDLCGYMLSSAADAAAVPGMSASVSARSGSRPSLGHCGNWKLVRVDK